MSISILEKCIKPYITKKGSIYACGQCTACKKQRVTEWTLRGKHELMTTPGHDGVLITLTYSPKNLVVRAKKKEVKEDCRGTLVPEHMTLFMKRFRKFLKEKMSKELRYMYAGEYGSNYWRPHYHLICFGISYNDLDTYATSQKEELRKIEKPTDKNLAETMIRNIWKLGHVDIDVREMHENAIQYTVGYINKKVGNIFGGEKHYAKNNRVAPFMRTSKGIGGEWAEIYKNSWTESLKIAHDMKKVSVPRYYLKKIYKEEGETIAYDIRDIDGEKKRHYKVIKNPDGEYTQKIEIQKFKNKMQSVKKELERREEKYHQGIKSIFLNTNSEQNNFKIKNNEYYERIMNGEINEVIRECQRETQERILQRERAKKSNKTRTENEIIMRKFGLRGLYKELQKKAKDREDYMKTSPYGKRNIYDLSEELTHGKKANINTKGDEYIEPIPAENISSEKITKMLQKSGLKSEKAINELTLTFA